MTKNNRLRKDWERNWELFECKGVYFNMGVPIKYWKTPKEVIKILKKEDREELRQLKTDKNPYIN